MNLLRFAGLTILLVVLESSYGQESMISKEQLQDMFDSMSEKTNWDMSGDMLWSYFFTDAEKSTLESAAPVLEEMGYSVRSIYLSDKESEDDPDLWWLHVEKVETHSVDSLDKINLIFYEFAETYGLDSYDGMDVGPATAAH